MISSLSVKNIALIDALNIEFEKGLNIISGETGAGKSILIDSINFVLGDRADKSLIRHGEDTARVEMVFLLDEKNELKQIFEELGLEFETTVIVSRTLSVNGRGDCRVNGRAVTLSMLRKIVVTLVDIHAQHENQSLMNVQSHIRLLDSYAIEVVPLLDQFRKEFDEYKALDAEKRGFSDAEDRRRQIELLEYQVNEIQSAAIREGEEEELLEKRTKFYHLEHILTSVSAAIDALDGEESSAIRAISIADASILSVAKYDATLEQLTNRFDALKVETADITEELKSYLEASDFETADMETVEQRLETIRALKRKYGKTTEDIQRFLQTASDKLEKLYNCDERLLQIDAIMEKKAKILTEMAKNISDKRSLAAIRFETAILSNLNDLGMVNTEFKVQIETDFGLENLSENGADKIEFLISANKGEPLKPLQKIASGGELSRFMLALKNIIAELDGIDTLIFDEIDTGISGNIAKVVAQKLYNIAKLRQVLVVTHLPQIAAMADKHFLIEKFTRGEKTVTSVTPLDKDAELTELIRLSGGNINSDVSLNHAKEMKNWANQYKNNF